MKKRTVTLLCAVLLCVYYILLAGMVLRVVSAPALSAAAVSCPEEVPARSLSAVNGEVCVTENGAVIQHTGIPVSSLPSADQLALAQGIPIADEGELSLRLEDFSS